jgi:hypothetical protein
VRTPTGALRRGSSAIAAVAPDASVPASVLHDVLVRSPV